MRKPTPPALESLLDAFAEIPDPRVARTRAHPLVNVLTMALFGTICGADGWEALELFAEQRADFFGRFLSMPKGTPSADTFRRVFEALDPKSFQDAFRRWLKPILDNLEGQTIAIDGKSLRGALAHAREQGGAFHLMHVWATGQRMLLGQKAVTNAGDEVGAALELLTVLDVRGATVTADANTCTTSIAAAVRQGGADYVFALKGNRGPLYNHVRHCFEEAEANGYRDASISESREEAHGRLESRVVRALGFEPSAPSKKWTDLRTIVQVDRLRSADKLSFERSYYVTSIAPDAAQLATRIRDHWKVENELHYCLDVTFDEDRRKIRDENGAQNFALVTRYALAMLKREPSKMSVAMKRRKAAWGDTYLLDVLASGTPQL